MTFATTKKSPSFGNGFEEYCAKMDRRAFTGWFAQTNRANGKR